jgi:predicted TIM-barrel fold metal-dependent hydrolase
MAFPASSDIVISADSHVAEVEACFEQIDSKFRNARPRAADDAEIGAFMAIPNIDMKVPMGSLCRAGTPPEKWNVPIGWDELHPAGYEPKARLDIQDEEGVGAEVIYPSVGMVLCLHPDPDYKKATFDAYNRWLAEFCEPAPDRLIGMPMVALRTIEEGIAEVRALAEAGFRGVMLPGNPIVEDYDHECYDPFWEACIALGLPVCFHILTTKGDIGGEVRGKRIIGQINTIRGNQNIVMMLVFGGVFDRHPDLRIVMVENDAGWVPHFCFRMDHAWERHRWWMDAGSIQRPPSEYFHRNVYVTFQDDYSVKHVIDAVNLDRVMWATDFPHGDGTYPESRKIIEQVTTGMNEAQQRAITRDNVAKLYGLSV